MSERTRLVIAVAATAVVLGLVAQVLRYTFERLLVERAGRGREDGIDVEVMTVFPAPGDDLVLRVTDKIYQPDPLVLPGAILHVEPRVGPDPFEQRWFARGTSAVATVSVRPVRRYQPGTLPLRVEVEHTRHGGRPMHEMRDTTTVDVDVRIYDASARFWGRVRVAAQAWGLFLLWFVVVVRIARRYRHAGPGRHARLDVVGIVIGLVGGAAVGDIVFGLPVLVSFGHEGFDARVALALVWVGLPLAWLWLQARRRSAAAPWLPGARARQRTPSP